MNKKYSPNLGLFLDNFSFAALQVCLTKAAGIVSITKCQTQKAFWNREVCATLLFCEGSEMTVGWQKAQLIKLLIRKVWEKCTLPGNVEAYSLLAVAWAEE